MLRVRLRPRPCQDSLDMRLGFALPSVGVVAGAGHAGARHRPSCSKVPLPERPPVQVRLPVLLSVVPGRRLASVEERPDTGSGCQNMPARRPLFPLGRVLVMMVG
jgi:hypothetical protein